MNARIIVLLAALASAVMGCDGKTPLRPSTGMNVNPRAEWGAPEGRANRVLGEAEHVEGAIGPGALYSLDRPAEWNGDLVIWVRGYVPSCAPVELPEIAPLRDALLAQGFGVASTSFSENGYAVSEGVQQTLQLSGLYTSRLGRPNRTFIIGVSLGGIIGLKLIEKYPEQYAGALLVSGVVGGTAAEVQYIGDTRVLFDCAYPGVLPGSLFDTPPCGTPFPVEAVVGAMQTDPSGVQAMLCMNPDLPFADPIEAATSVATALGFQWVGAEDLFDRTHGQSLYDNADVVYSCPLLPSQVVAGINACVARYDATPAAEAFLRSNYEPVGNINVPVMTLHNTRDPVVPIFHEELYRAKVAQQGRLGFLLQRSKDSYGHVNFGGAELLGAFAELVAWVSSGQKPVA